MDQLSPTLSLQYYPLLRAEWVEPYVGMGLTYTLFFDEETSPSLANALGDPGTDIEVDETFSVAFQLGADWPVTERLSVNSSLWYIDMDTEADMRANGSTTTVDVGIDPWVTMVGVTFSF